jgi:hypothetical protein
MIFMVVNNLIEVIIADKMVPNVEPELALGQKQNRWVR